MGQARKQRRLWVEQVQAVAVPAPTAKKVGPVLNVVQSDGDAARRGDGLRAGADEIVLAVLGFKTERLWNVTVSS